MFKIFIHLVTLSCLVLLASGILLWVLTPSQKKSILNDWTDQQVETMSLNVFGTSDNCPLTLTCRDACAIYVSNNMSFFRYYCWLFIFQMLQVSYACWYLNNPKHSITHVMLEKIRTKELDVTKLSNVNIKFLRENIQRMSFLTSKEENDIELKEAEDIINLHNSATKIQALWRG